MSNGEPRLCFLDDSRRPANLETGATITTLTALLVPLRRYAEARTAFYDALHAFVRPSPSTVGKVPELHGVEFLPDCDEETKCDVFRAVVDLVRDSQLKVYRVGYVLDAAAKQLIHGDAAAVGLCWMGILTVLQAELLQAPLIPVFDGFNQDMIDSLSNPIRFMDTMRAAGLEESVSIRNSENILGEVFYADSKHSIFVQVVDIVSYLLQKREFVKERGDDKVSAFARELSEIGAAVDEFTAVNTVKRLQVSM